MLNVFHHNTLLNEDRLSVPPEYDFEPVFISNLVPVKTENFDVFYCIAQNAESYFVMKGTITDTVEFEVINQFQRPVKSLMTCLDNPGNI